ncbi:MAG: hypothetical protein ACTSQJ_09435 [Promethearchaeota archaeon]
MDKEPEKPELYPYIYSINFKELTSIAKKKITTDAIKCSLCGAVLTDIQRVQEDNKVGVYYKCEYCGTINILDKTTIIEELPDDIDFILEDVEKKEDKEEIITKIEEAKGDLYISIIDISGSMSGAKIEAVKKSLIQTIKDFKVNSPATKYILITFESSVGYYLKHNKAPIKFNGVIIYGIESIKKRFENIFNEKEFIGSIGEFADGWIRKIQSLRALDMTALGPALYLGILSVIKFQFNSGRITLLTDGLANKGVGNLSGTSLNAEKFYKDMAQLCNKNNIIVDVVGVSAPRDNNEMGLQILGELSDKTGGKLFLISSDEMEAIFSELRQTRYIGKDVKVKIITPNNIRIKNITGAFSSTNKLAKPEINLGAITEDRELFLEIDPSSTEFKNIVAEQEEIPIQLQVEYKDKDGRKRLRVINDKVKITDDENEFKANYDQKLNVMMNIQESGSIYYKGKAGKSKRKLEVLKAALSNEMQELKRAGGAFHQSKYEESLDFLNDELEEMEFEEIKVKKAPRSSYFAAVGQARARISSELIKKRLLKKKEKKE